MQSAPVGYTLGQEKVRYAQERRSRGRVALQIWGIGRKCITGKNNDYIDVFVIVTTNRRVVL